MSAKEFVAGWRAEKDEMVAEYTNPQGQSAAAQLLVAMNLDEHQRMLMSEAIDVILTDAFYTLLLGLDGAANIGGRQESFTIHDKDGNLVAESGKIEAEAWDQFHGGNS